MDTFTLHSFNSAKINNSAMPISPPIYVVTVEGELIDFNTEIKLVNKGIEKGYVVINVEGNEVFDTGQKAYKKTIDIQKTKETKGVIIKGANEEKTLDWPKKAVEK